MTIVKTSSGKMSQEVSYFSQENLKPTTSNRGTEIKAASQLHPGKHFLTNFLNVFTYTHNQGHSIHLVMMQGHDHSSST